MAEFYTYAEVLDERSPQARLYAAGRLPARPGRPLREYTEGGQTEFRMPLTKDMRTQLRQVATLTGNTQLKWLADQTEVAISLAHLLRLDPETRIVCGAGLKYTQEEARRLNLSDPAPAHVPDQPHL